MARKKRAPQKKRCILFYPSLAHRPHVSAGKNAGEISMTIIDYRKGGQFLRRH